MAEWGRSCGHVGTAAAGVCSPVRGSERRPDSLFGRHVGLTLHSPQWRPSSWAENPLQQARRESPPAGDSPSSHPFPEGATRQLFPLCLMGSQNRVPDAQLPPPTPPRAGHHHQLRPPGPHSSSQTVLIAAAPQVALLPTRLQVPRPTSRGHRLLPGESKYHADTSPS